MAKVHFLTTNLPLNQIETQELVEQTQEALTAKGRPDDKVIVLVQCSWQGCIDDD